MRTSRVAALIVLALGIAAAACAESHLPNAALSPVATRVAVRQLIGGPGDASFKLVLQWDGAPTSSGRSAIVWRQDGRQRRLDYSPTNSSGQFFSATDFASESSQQEGCDWYGSAPGRIMLSCGYGPPSVFVKFDWLFNSLVGSPQASAVNGRPAHCYPLIVSEFRSGTVCIDDALHAPLLVETPSDTFRMVCVAIAAQPLPTPAALIERTIAAGVTLRDVQMELPKDALALPTPSCED